MQLEMEHTAHMERGELLVRGVGVYPELRRGLHQRRFVHAVGLLRVLEEHRYEGRSRADHFGRVHVEAHDGGAPDLGEQCE